MKEHIVQPGFILKLKAWGQQYLPALIIPAIACGGITLFQFNRLSSLEASISETLSKEAYQIQDRQTKAQLALLKQSPTLGFDNLIAGWTYLNFIQYFGDDDARKETGYKMTADFFDIIVERDPLFLAMYPYLSASVTLYGGQPQKTVALLAKGAAAIPPQLQPEAYFLWQAKATDELLFLGNNQAAQQAYLKAADWASRSPDPDIQARAERSRETAAFLATNPDSRRARVASWYNLLTNAVDDAIRQFAIQQLTALGGTVSVDEQGAWQVKLPPED